MIFEKDARKAGISNLLIAFIISSALVSAQIFIFSKPDMPSMIIFISWFVCGLMILVCLWQGIVLLKSGGKWLIVIDDNRVDWQSPNESVDKSFNVIFSDVSKLETRQRTKKSSGSSSKDYVLVLKNGSEIKLSPNSGINLVQVVLELEKKGLKHEFVNT